MDSADPMTSRVALVLLLGGSEESQGPAHRPHPSPHPLVLKQHLLEPLLDQAVLLGQRLGHALLEEDVAA